jgi:hypothetical protein
MDEKTVDDPAKKEVGSRERPSLPRDLSGGTGVVFI